MPPKVNQGSDRYPKRKRAEVNYEVDMSIDGDLDLEDDGYFSEELGEDSSASANPTTAQQPDTAAEVDSEFEDATFGSRRTKKVGRTPHFASHNLLTQNSVRSLRSPRPSPNPRSSVLPSSSHSGSCKPFPRLSEAIVFPRRFLNHLQPQFSPPETSPQPGRY